MAVVLCPLSMADDDAWALFGGADEEATSAEEAAEMVPRVVGVPSGQEEAYRAVQRFVHLNLARACTDVRMQLGQELHKLASASQAAFVAYCTGRLEECRRSARSAVVAAWDLHKQRRWGNVCVREVFLMNQLMTCLCETVLLAAGALSPASIGTWRDEMAGASPTTTSDTVGALESIIQRLDLAVILGAPGEVVQLALDAAEGLRLPHLCATQGGDDTVFEEHPRLYKDWEVTRPIVRRHAGDLPSVEEFRMSNYEGDAPVVLEGTMEQGHWSAPTLWKKTAFWRHGLGHRLLPVEVGTMVAEVAALESGSEASAESGDDGKWYEDLLTGREFLERFVIPSIKASAPEQEGGWEAPVGYMAQHPLCEQVAALKEGFRVPDYCSVGTQLDKNINVWFGTHGTVTALHYDSYDNFLSQAVGWKYVRLYAPKETDKLYPVAVAKSGRSGIAAQQNISRVHVGAPDDAQFPLFSTAEYQETVLAPGDILYIPTGWWHYVESLSPSVSINFWF